MFRAKLVHEIKGTVLYPASFTVIVKILKTFDKYRGADMSLARPGRK